MDPLKLKQINSDAVYDGYALRDEEVPIWVYMDKRQIFLRSRMRRVIQHMQRVCAAERKEAVSLFLLRVYMRALDAHARLETIHKEEELWRKFQ